MMSLYTIVRTVVSRLLFLILIIAAFPFVIAFMVLPEHVRYASRFLFKSIQLFYAGVIGIMRLCRIPVLYTYDTREQGTMPVVFVANHQSALDVPLLGALSHGKPHIWLARSELMRWKFLRWILPRLAVVVDVTSREKAMSSLLRLVRLVQGKDVDIMIFPEGARYTDDTIHPFYGGFVMLAKLLKRPVVPVCILGVNKVYPPHTIWVHRHPVEVRVGKPMFFKENESEESFKDRVHQWFVKEMES